MAQPAGFLSQDNRTDMGIPVFWITANSDPPWNFKIWLDQFFLAVTKKESVNPEKLLEEPKEVLLEPLPRPETPREHENAQAITEREARDQLARDKISFWTMKKEKLEDQRLDTTYITTRYRKE